MKQIMFPITTMSLSQELKCEEKKETAKNKHASRSEHGIITIGII